MVVIVNRAIIVNEMTEIDGQKVLFTTRSLLVPCIATPASASGYMAAQQQPRLCYYPCIYAFISFKKGNLHVYLYSHSGGEEVESQCYELVYFS